MRTGPRWLARQQAACAQAQGCAHQLPRASNQTVGCVRTVHARPAFVGWPACVAHHDQALRRAQWGNRRGRGRAGGRAGFTPSGGGRFSTNMCACEASGLQSGARTGAGHAYLVAAPLHVIVEWLAAGRPASVGITAAVLAVDVLALHGGASDGSRRDLGQWPAAGKGGNEWIRPQSQPTGGLVPTSALHCVTSI